jgi:large subunit ribosomal protein L18
MAKNLAARLRRKRSIRKKVVGTSDRPRLTVFRSAKHIYAQVVNDADGQTVVAVSTLAKELREQKSPKLEAAKAVGAAIAKACQDKGVTSVVFDRNGFMYHGRVRALADAAREAGLSF